MALAISCVEAFDYFINSMIVSRLFFAFIARPILVATRGALHVDDECVLYFLLFFPCSYLLSNCKCV